MRLLAGRRGFRPDNSPGSSSAGHSRHSRAQGRPLCSSKAGHSSSSTWPVLASGADTLQKAWGTPAHCSAGAAGASLLNPPAVTACTHQGATVSQAAGQSGCKGSIAFVIAGADKLTEDHNHPMHHRVRAGISVSNLPPTCHLQRHCNAPMHCAPQRGCIVADSDLALWSIERQRQRPAPSATKPQPHGALGSAASSRGPECQECYSPLFLALAVFLQAHRV